jgi:4-amino-4-deoxy-L-arabinose transferase-like glycosyltransferase
MNEQHDISHDVKMIQRLVLRLGTARATAPPLWGHLAVKPTTRWLYQWFVQHREELWIVAILLVAALAHGINMFNFPTYVGDEGIYMSQAWAVAKEGRLAPYTYDYGHAPLGWIQLAIWSMLTGGFHTFGMTINSGRVLMLIMQVGSTFLLYRIARSISHSVTVASLACLLFALSPFAIYLHRRVLLDNITTFWMLLSIILLVSGRFSLKRVWLSAAALGISILSKENTGFLVPVLTYLVFLLADESHRWFATIGWTAIVCCIVSMYILMAILKGELFPEGTLLGGTNPHVSLIYSLLWQSGRQRDGGLFDFNSQFWHMATIWAHAEPLLVIVGSLFALISAFLLASKRQKLVGVMGVATLSLGVFLVRGSITLDFYLAPLLPLLALNVALVLGLVANNAKTFLQRYGGLGLMGARGVQMIMVGLCLAGIVAGFSSPNPGSPDLGFRSDPLLLWKTSPAVVAQIEAIDWVTKNVPSCSSILIDPYMWTDLHDIPNRIDGYRFAHSYWQVALDPAIRDGVFHDNWRNVDYVVDTPGFLFDTYSNHLQLVAEALTHSTVVTRFDIRGWPIEIRRVNNGKVKLGQGCLSPPA